MSSALFVCPRAAKASFCRQFTVTLLTKGPGAAARLLAGSALLQDLRGDYNYTDLVVLQKEIYSLYDPKETFFVGLGRSPFPLVKVFNQIVPDSAETVPLSYNLHNTWSPWRSFRKEGVEAYSRGGRFEYPAISDSDDSPTRVWKQYPILRENVFSFFDDYFPKPEVIKGRKVVLFDFADYGTSLAKFYKDVEEWKIARKLAIDIEILFLQQRSNPPASYWGDGKWEAHLFVDTAISDPNKVRYKTIDLKANHRRLQKIFDAELLKMFAPYGNYTITHEPYSQQTGPKKNVDYELFSAILDNEFARAMASDPQFYRWFNQVRGLK